MCMWHPSLSGSAIRFMGQLLMAHTTLTVLIAKNACGDTLPPTPDVAVLFLSFKGASPRRQASVSSFLDPAHHVNRVSSVSDHYPSSSCHFCG